MSIQKGTCTNKDNDYYKRKLSIIRDTDKNRNTKQGCQKQPAAGENRQLNRPLLGQYRPATLLGISLRMAFFK